MAVSSMLWPVTMASISAWRCSSFCARASVASLNDMSLGNYGFMTMLHEIGHAVGLTHPGAYDASQDRPISYSADAEYAEDSRQYTVMSYSGRPKLAPTTAGATP